jgi:hypothetical protein
MPDHPSKTAWERDNVLKILVKINRNTDPELYALLQQAANKSGTARDLMRQAITEDPKK